MDSNQTIVIYDISNKSNKKHFNKLEGVICTGRGPKEAILDMKFDNNDKTLVIGCVKSIYFANFHMGELQLTRGTGWKKNGTPEQSIMCIAFQDTSILTGSFSGKLLVWKGTSLMDPSYLAHDGVLTCINNKKSGNGKGFITGGNDGVIIVWDTGFNKERIID